MLAFFLFGLGPSGRVVLELVRLEFLLGEASARAEHEVEGLLGLGGLALLHRRYQVLQTAIVDLDDDCGPIRAVALLLALQLGLGPLVDRIRHLD